MATPARPRVMFDTDRLAYDMAVRGWEQKDLAAAARLSLMTVNRFLRGEVQTTKTATRLAGAMGYSVRRYVVRVASAA